MVAKDQYHHGNLRQALVDAAVAVIETQGVEGLSLRAVARQAGVSQSAPYHHFKDKEALLVEVCHLGFIELVERMRATVAAHDCPMDQLGALGQAYVQFGKERTSYFRIMWGNFIEDKGQYPELSCAALGAFEVVLSVIVAGQHRGVIRNDPPAELGAAAWAAVHGAARLIVDKGLESDKMIELGMSGERMLDAVTETIRRGFSPQEA